MPRHTYTAFSTYLLHHDRDLAEVGARALRVEVAVLDRLAAVRVPAAVIRDFRIPPDAGPPQNLKYKQV